MSTNKSLSNIYKKVKLLNEHNPRRGVNILTTEGSADILVAFLLTENTVMYVQKFTNRLTAPADLTRHFCISDYNNSPELLPPLLDAINTVPECLTKFDVSELHLFHNAAEGPINFNDCSRFNIGINHKLLKGLLKNLETCTHPQPDHRGVPYHEVPLLIYISNQLKAGRVKQGNVGFRIHPNGYVTFQGRDDVLVIQAQIWKSDKYDEHYHSLDHIVSNLGVK